METIAHIVIYTFIAAHIFVGVFFAVKLHNQK